MRLYGSRLNVEHFCYVSIDEAPANKFGHFKLSCADMITPLHIPPLLFIKQSNIRLHIQSVTGVNIFAFFFSDWL